MLKFTEDHEWVRLDGDIATVGITDHAQEQLGDLVYVELPRPGSTVEQGAPTAIVESVKAASDVYAPLAGEIVAVNEQAATDPSLVNAKAMSEGWLFKIRIADPAQFDALLDEAAYRARIGAQPAAE